MNSDNTQEKEVIPSVRNRDDLAKLSVEFKPTDVKFLLALNVDSSKEDCIAAATGMTDRLSKFIENGYDHEKANLDVNKYKHRVFKRTVN